MKNVFHLLFQSSQKAFEDHQEEIGAGQDDLNDFGLDLDGLDNNDVMNDAGLDFGDIFRYSFQFLSVLT